eukprot:462548_1
MAPRPDHNKIASGMSSVFLKRSVFRLRTLHEQTARRSSGETETDSNELMLTDVTPDNVSWLNNNINLLHEQMKITKKEIDSITSRINDELKETALTSYRHKLVDMLLKEHKTLLDDYDKESKLYQKYKSQLNHVSNMYFISNMINAQPVNNECGGKSIQTCTHLNNLLAVVDNYTNSNNNSKNIKDFNHVNILHTLDDYLHLMNNHDDDIQFKELVNKFKHCDIKTCTAFRRQNQEYVNTLNTAVMEILDKIHCYICHCYDTGSRLSIY